MSARSNTFDHYVRLFIQYITRRKRLLLGVEKDPREKIFPVLLILILSLLIGQEAYEHVLAHPIANSTYSRGSGLDSQSRFSVLWNGSHIFFYLGPLTDSSSTTKFSIESSLHQGIRMLVRARRRSTNWVQFGEVDPLFHSGGYSRYGQNIFFP